MKALTSQSDRIIFRPFSFFYLIILVSLFLFTIAIITFFFRELIIEGVGIPSEFFIGFLFLCLFGSYVNIPLTLLKSRAPILVNREVKLFWVRWRIPRVEIGVRKTLVTLNLGGAIVPILVSVYLLLWSIPRHSSNVLITYFQTFIVLIIVTWSTNRSSKLVKGLGIATPALGPPLTTAIATMLTGIIWPISSPTQIAYIGGVLGTLVGADLMNLSRFSELGAPVVSIGGAGTFDGIYITGLVSVLLVLFLI